MLTTLLIASLLSVEPPPTLPTTSSETELSPAPGPRVEITLRGGKKLVGIISSQDLNGIELQLDTGTVHVATESITMIERAPDSPMPPPRPTPAPKQAPRSPTSRVEVTLRDGRKLQGIVTAQDPSGLDLQLDTGPIHIAAESISLIAPVTIPAARAAAPTPPPQLATAPAPAVSTANAFQSVNRTRYLYAPSAMMLRAGEGYVSQTEALLTSVAVGVTDHITLLAGSVLPAMLLGPEAINFVGGIKIGGSISETLHLAAGAEALIVPGLTSLEGFGFGFGFVFGTATLGTPDLNASIAVGKPFALSQTGAAVGAWIAVVSGSARLNDLVALVTENWLLLGVDAGPIPDMFNGLAIRLMARQYSLDLGVIRVANSLFPLPWIDLSCHWN